MPKKTTDATITKSQRRWPVVQNVFFWYTRRAH